MPFSPPEQCCRDCGHFRNEAAFIETAFAGLTSLGSAYGSVRGDDGLCLRHDRYLGGGASCADFVPRRGARPGDGRVSEE